MTQHQQSGRFDPRGTVSRRDWLRWGGGLGLGLVSGAGSGVVRAALRADGAIRACILIFYYGGPSHLDTWDPKPAAPREVRGEFRTIRTSVPGLILSEHLPHTARVADRLTILRGVHHRMTNHNAAAFATLSGRPPARGDQELLGNDRNDPPCLGSILSHALPARDDLPTFVALPHPMTNVVRLPGQMAGFLGSAHDPYQVDSDPNTAAFRLDELTLPADLSPDRLDRREALLRGIGPDRGQGGDPFAAYQARAGRLVRSRAVRRAFDLEGEDPRLRDRYGRTTHGQSLLLARRLVEAGVRFVAVNDGEVNGQDRNWDSHASVFPRHRDALIPPADRGFAALVEDLESRGLLESTLVVALGEFGRTPKINAAAGRDHWPHCFSALVAGGGAGGGLIHGASDKLGVAPDRDGVTPADLAATIYWRFGLDPAREIRDLTGRPYPLSDGQPIRAIFGSPA